jgi:hypothetical protein
MTKLQRLSTSLLALEIAALLVTPMLLLLAYLSQSTIAAYRRDGVVYKASVVDKLEGSSQLAPYCIKAGFFDRSLLEGGELHMPVICGLVSGPLWASYEQGDEIEVVVLEADPDNQVLLRDSLDPANLALIHKYVTGVVALAIGLILAASRRAIAHLDRPKPEQART